MISVTGTGSSRTAPDAAHFTIGVQLIRPNVGDATARASALASAVIEALDNHGVAAADIRTTDYHLHPEYDHRRQQPTGHPGPPPLVGYRVSNNLQVTVRDLDTLSAVIDAATVAAGDGASVHGLSFGVADGAAAEAEARAVAWEDARSRAQHLADLAQVTLGTVVSVTEHTPGTGPPRPVMMRSMAADAGGAPPMEAGSSTIAVSLSVAFAIGSAT